MTIARHLNRTLRSSRKQVRALNEALATQPTEGERMMPITRDSKCPLCGSRMTTFQHPLSDTGATLPCKDQRCSLSSCELPVKLWDEIEKLKPQKNRPRPYESPQHYSDVQCRELDDSLRDRMLGIDD